MDMPVETQPTEQQLRRQLTDFYHLVTHLGWSEMIFNHISVRVPGPEHHYLMNPFGLLYEEITPENLIKVGIDGKLVEESPYPGNPAGFALHGVIHEHRPDVTCVAHTHTNPVSAIATRKDGISHNNFYGAQLYGRVGYHDFEGITLYDDERDRMLASLGTANVLVLRNHGIAVCERSVPATFMLLWTVQRAAEIQCMGSGGGAENELSDEVKQRCADDATRLATSGRFSEMVFNAAVRRMRAEQAR